MKQKILEESPLDAIFERIDQTLQRGGNVFVVGDLVPDPPQLPKLQTEAEIPLPQVPTELDYGYYWSRRLYHHLRLHVVNVKELPVVSTTRQSKAQARLFHFRGFKK